MEFVLYCIDKPGRAGIRADTRASHLAFTSGRQQAFRFGGPLLDEAGRPHGSLMILDLPSREALEAHMRADPFFRVDLFESVTVWTTRQVLPEREPGALTREIDVAREVVAAPLHLRAGPIVMLRASGEHAP